MPPNTVAARVAWRLKTNAYKPSACEILLRQREEWIRFSYSNEDTKDEERRKGWVVDRRLNVVPSAKPVPVS
jgi:hypothetical protein